MGTVISGIFAWLLPVLANNIIGIIVVALVGVFGSKIADFVKKHQFAQTLILVAQDVVHQVAAANPNLPIAQLIDKAIDKLVEVTGISKEVATRVITSAIAQASVSGSLSVAKTLNVTIPVPPVTP